MNSYVNQIEDRDWDNSANGKAFFFPVWNFTHTIAFMSNAFCFTFSSIFLYLDDAFIGGEHKVGVSTYLWEEESPDAWYGQQFEDSYFHTLDDWNNYNLEDWGGMHTAFILICFVCLVRSTKHFNWTLGILATTNQQHI